MAADFEDFGQLQTALECPMFSETNGKEIGSISASIYWSDTGEPNSHWKALPIYAAKQESHGKEHLYTGFVESTAGRYIAITLTWRTKKGIITKEWKAPRDILANFAFDGRAMSAMEYSIIKPGAKNPLPLSGLWSTDTVRCPLRWRERTTNRNAPNPDDQPGAFHADPVKDSPSSAPPRPALMSVDDLSSFRITIHDKFTADNARDKKLQNWNAFNQEKTRYSHEAYAHKTLSHTLDIGGPADHNKVLTDALLNGSGPFPKSLPFLEFRIYYKSRKLLRELGYLPGSRNEVHTQVSPPRSSVPLAAIPAPRAESASNIQVRPSESKQASTVPAKRPASDTTKDSASRTAPTKVKHEEDAQSQHFANNVNFDSNLDDLPPLAESSGQTTTTAAATSSHAAVSSQARPIAAMPRTATPISQDKPTSSGQNPSTPAQKWRDNAMSFLEEIDLADDENVEALLAVGFKMKQRWLKLLASASQADLKWTVDGLRERMSRLEFNTLVDHIKQQTGVTIDV